MLSQADTASQTSSFSAARLRTAYAILNVAGSNILLPLLVLTFLCTGVRRRPTMVNMCIVWIVVGTVASLAFYGGLYNARDPRGVLCTVQASLVFATPPMGAAALLTFVFRFWLTVKSAVQNQKPLSNSTICGLLSISAPYIVFIAFAIAGFAIAFNNQSEVTLSRQLLYCSVQRGAYSITAAATTAVLVIATCFFNIKICIILVGLSSGGKLGFRPGASKTDLQFIARVGIFGVYLAVGFILSLVSLVGSSLPPDLFQATVPLSMVLLFGSQPELFRAWWNLHNKTQQTDSIAKSQLSSTCTPMSEAQTGLNSSPAVV